jgi:hypothetical protein
MRQDVYKRCSGQFGGEKNMWFLLGIEPGLLSHPGLVTLLTVLSHKLFKLVRISNTILIQNPPHIKLNLTEGRIKHERD